MTSLRHQTGISIVIGYVESHGQELKDFINLKFGVFKFSSDLY